MTLKKTKLVLGIATAIFTLAGAMASPEVLAHKKAKAHKHSHKTSKKVVRSRAIAVTSSNAAPVAVADNSALQSQVDSLSAEVNKLKSQPAPVMAEPVVAEKSKDNMVFFRGGWAHANRERPGVSIYSDSIGGSVKGLNGAKADKDAWYFGAGLDFSVDDNLFGLMNNTEVLAEVMFEYREYADKVAGNLLSSSGLSLAPVAGGGACTGCLNVNNAGAARDVTVSQFTLNASPKIKFMKGSSFRPWIIPVGFAINVISPPSESITVLQPAMMFGLGADYKLWKNIYLGADARYQQNIGRTLDGVQTNGFSLGGYLGLGF